MHFVHDLVLRVRERREVVVGRVPRPGAGPRVALDKDVLRRGARGADAVDGGLVEVEDEGLVHVVELVVGVEDDARVGGELGGDGLPPGAEGGGVGDDVAVVAAVVVRVENSVFARVSDEVDDGREVFEVGRVDGAGELVGDKALHGEGYAEGVEAIVDVRL